MAGTDRAFYQDVGRRLLALRAVLDISEREAATAAGVTLRTWRRMEAGGAFRSALPFVRLFDRYRLIGMGWLFGQGGGLWNDAGSPVTGGRVVVLPRCSTPEVRQAAKQWGGAEPCA